MRGKIGSLLFVFVGLTFLLPMLVCGQAPKAPTEEPTVLNEEPKREIVQVTTVSEEEALSRLAKHHKDAKGELEATRQKANDRMKSIVEFMQKVGQDEKLARAVESNFLHALKDRGLLGPLDRVTIEQRDFSGIDVLLGTQIIRIPRFVGVPIVTFDCVGPGAHRPRPGQSPFETCYASVRLVVVIDGYIEIPKERP